MRESAYRFIVVVYCASRTCVSAYIAALMYALYRVYKTHGAVVYSYSLFLSLSFFVFPFFFFFFKWRARRRKVGCRRHFGKNQFRKRIREFFSLSFLIPSSLPRIHARTHILSLSLSLSLALKLSWKISAAKIWNETSIKFRRASRPPFSLALSSIPLSPLSPTRRVVASCFRARGRPTVVSVSTRLSISQWQAREERDFPSYGNNISVSEERRKSLINWRICSVSLRKLTGGPGVRSSPIA